MYYYELIGYNKKHKKNGQEYLDDICTITLIAENNDEALIKAMGMIEKKFWRIAKVAETNHGHMEKSEEIQVLQLEMQKKLIDTLKGK